MFVFNRIWGKELNVISHVRFFLSHDIKLLKSKKEGKDQESIQSSTTPDPGHVFVVLRKICNVKLDVMLLYLICKRLVGYRFY